MLIESVASGDKQALEQLFARHSARIYRFVLRMIGNADKRQETHRVKDPGRAYDTRGASDVTRSAPRIHLARSRKKGTAPRPDVSEI